MANIRQGGLVSGQGIWPTQHQHPGDLEFLNSKPGLSLGDTRPLIGAVAAVCACGEELGALYYSCRHNATATNNTPILIEFEAERSASAIDGKDFLYTAFQLGDPERARRVLERSFGERVLRYAEKAWSSEDQLFRIAQCDLAIHDPDVIEAHYINEVILAGRHGTVFRNAFTVSLPIGSEAIRRVWSPREPITISEPTISLFDILR